MSLFKAISAHSKQHIQWCAHTNIALGGFAKLRKLLSLSRLSVHLRGTTRLAPIERIFTKLGIGIYFLKPKKSQLLLKSDKSNGTLHEDR
jgi:hypothetical protein